jgi:drug/metabolite transporter (DMT)-like permease
MNTPILLWILPIIASILFAIGSLMLKEAMARGVGPMRVVFISNWMIAFLWLSFYLIDPVWPQGEFWWTPFLGGLTRVLGGACLLTALRIGDVSIQTPLGGLKVVFVTLFAGLIGSEVLNEAHWVASFLTLISVYLLGKNTSGVAHEQKRIIRAIILSFLAAICFGFGDVLSAFAGEKVGVKAYMSYNFFTSAIGVLLFIPFFQGRLRDIHKTCWPWLLGGTFFLGLEVMLLMAAITLYKEATTVNILYALRGIWAILLVWFLGHWFHNKERDQGKKVMIQRLMGSILLVAAIILVLIY